MRDDEVAVIAGLDPAIHRIFIRRWMRVHKKMDARVKPAHDEFEVMRLHP
jgi:hypothetical protein